MLTYVWRQKVRSSNPGYCYLMAGWRTPPKEIHPTGESADRKKRLLWKPFGLAGVAP
jgi:hypothetical protein